MERRLFLKYAVRGLGASAGMPANGIGVSPFSVSVGAEGQGDFPSDNFHVPDWLNYSRTVYFDGYCAPLYPHIKDFDARRLVDVVVELGGNTLRFQPIGYWAYYPSKSFRVHPELGNRDLIDEVSRECRRRGIHHYCYTAAGHAHMEVGWVNSHPRYADWVLRGPDGKPYGRYPHIGWLPPRQKVCATGDTFREGMRQVARELCEHDIDGVYFDAVNAFPHSGICFCDSCRRNFKAFSGMDLERLSGFVKKYTPNGFPVPWTQLPAGVDMEALQAWFRWADELVKEDLLYFRKITHGSGKFVMFHTSHAWDGASLPLHYRIPDGFMAEASMETHERLITGLMDASMGRPYHKLVQKYLGSYSVTNFGEPAYERPWVVHNTNLEDRDEIRMEGMANLACGNVPIYATLNRMYFKVGSGSAKPVQDVFDVMRRVEEVHKGSTPAPYVSIVPTWASQQLWRQRKASWNWPLMSEGMGLALLDARISFDVNPSTEMSDEWLQGQKVIALCGASGISDEDARKLGDWVKAGGGLLATYDTGLYDVEGNLRQDGGALKEVLGVELKGEPLESQPECYYRVKEKHEALGEYGPGSIVEGDGRLVPVEAREGAKVLAECWNLGTEEVRGPAIVANTYGQGRTIYVSGSLEANYLYDRVLSTKKLLHSMVEYLAGGLPQLYKLKAPQGVYGMLRRAHNGDLALWVLGDVGFKDAAAGRMRQQYVAVPGVEAAIRIPQGRKAKGMRLLRADQPISFREEDGYAVGTIPKLHIAEIVHLELA